MTLVILFSLKSIESLEKAIDADVTCEQTFSHEKQNRITKLRMEVFFQILVYSDKTGSMRKDYLYSVVNEANLKFTL